MSFCIFQILVVLLKPFDLWLHHQIKLLDAPVGPNHGRVVGFDYHGTKGVVKFVELPVPLVKPCTAQSVTFTRMYHPQMLISWLYIFRFCLLWAARMVKSCGSLATMPCSPTWCPCTPLSSSTISTETVVRKSWRSMVAMSYQIQVIDPLDINALEPLTIIDLMSFHLSKIAQDKMHICAYSLTHNGAKFCTSL